MSKKFQFKKEHNQFRVEYLSELKRLLLSKLCVVDISEWDPCKLFYTLVLCIAQHQCARPHPREGYITCYLGNITVGERETFRWCLGNRLY